MFVFLASIILEIKVFLFIMAILALIACGLRIASAVALKNGKMIPSMSFLITLGCSLAYILTMIICGF